MNEIRAAFASMRPTLWVGISLNVVAASLALHIQWALAVYIAICLCLSSAFSFLINDLLDKDIDAANHVVRPRVPARWTLWLAIINLVAVVVPTQPLFGLASPNLAAALAGILLLAALYSLAFARVVLVKNISAALIATSPLWVCLFAVPISHSEAFLVVVAALALYILAREIKFDQFDAEGDRLGGRTTLPHVLPANIIDRLEQILTCAATGILLIVAILSADTLESAVIPAGLAAAIGLALYIPLRETKDIHYTTITRIAMIISPLYVVSTL